MRTAFLLHPLDTPAMSSPTPALAPQSDGYAHMAPMRRLKTTPKVQPRSNALTLTSERGLYVPGPSWRLVSETVIGLDSGSGDSFACLKVPGNTYVQCLRGIRGWHLEWRLATSLPGLDAMYVHVRGCRVGGSTRSMPLVKLDFTSEGEERDLVSLADVLEAFRAFYVGSGPPASLDWRELDI